MLSSKLCTINQPSLVITTHALKFINDLLRFGRVYFLKNRDMVYEKLKEFRELVENNFNQIIKCLRFVNWGEYVKNELEEYLWVSLFHNKGL